MAMILGSELTPPGLQVCWLMIEARFGTNPLNPDAQASGAISRSPGSPEHSFLSYTVVESVCQG